MKKNVLYVNLLGQFEIKNEVGVLNRETLHSNKLMRLLSYILMYREKELTVAELCDVIWRDGGSDNPAGALKNLMYRLRTSMKMLGDTPFILTKKHSYCWNEEVEVVADFEVFDKLCKMAVEANNDEEFRIESAKKAIEMYKGPLPVKLAAEHWGLPLETYYHSCYLTVVKYLADIYEEREEYDKMEMVSSNALIYDGLDEQLHCNVVKALVQQDKQNLAIAHYEKAVKQLQNHLGVRSATKLKELYGKLLTTKSGKPGDLKEIYEDVVETEQPNAVFICEYSVFREIYRLENRRLERIGITEYVLLITLVPLEEQLTETQMRKELGHLESVLKSQLRRGDVAAKYSDNQFIVLLPTCTQETAQVVAERVKGSFMQKSSTDRIGFEYELRAVTEHSPANVEEILEKE